jgi:hypothetical protein
MTAEQVRIEQLQSEVERYRDRVRECEETILMLRGARRLIEYHRDAVLQCYKVHLAKRLRALPSCGVVSEDQRHECIREAQRDADFVLSFEINGMTLTKEGE